jgi:integrase
LKHFARWVHEQPGGVFLRHGFPVGEVEALKTEEPECKKLSSEQVRALFAAARAAVQKTESKTASKAAANAQPRKAVNTPSAATKVAGKGRAYDGESRARPQRNLAMLGVMYYTGLRVSEVVALTYKQYDGVALYDVVRKGGRQARKLLLHPECARLLDYYIEHERELDVANAGLAFTDADNESGNASDSDGHVTNHGRDRDVAHGADASGAYAVDAAKPLFLSARTGGSIDRKRVGRMLIKLAAQASASGFVTEAFSVHPHQLRHTFGARYREASGSDTETAAALGHAGLQYVGRYVRKTDRERIDLLQKALFVDEDGHV